MRLLLLFLSSVSLWGIPISHKVAQNAIGFASPKKELPFTGFYRIEKQCKLFFKDLGAEQVDHSSGFSGFFLPASAIKYNSAKVFGKWREIIKKLEKQ